MGKAMSSRHFSFISNGSQDVFQRESDPKSQFTVAWSSGYTWALGGEKHSQRDFRWVDDSEFSGTHLAQSKNTTRGDLIDHYTHLTTRTFEIGGTWLAQRVTDHYTAQPSTFLYVTLYCCVGHKGVTVYMIHFPG
jgi:hypothetical protein